MIRNTAEPRNGVDRVPARADLEKLRKRTSALLHVLNAHALGKVADLDAAKASLMVCLVPQDSRATREELLVLVSALRHHNHRLMRELKARPPRPKVLPPGA